MKVTLTVAFYTWNSLWSELSTIATARPGTATTLFKLRQLLLKLTTPRKPSSGHVADGATRAGSRVQVLKLQRRALERGAGVGVLGVSGLRRLFAVQTENKAELNSFGSCIARDHVQGPNVSTGTKLHYQFDQAALSETKLQGPSYIINSTGTNYQRQSSRTKCFPRPFKGSLEKNSVPEALERPSATATFHTGPATCLHS
jgi:hypothetical protein